MMLRQGTRSIAVVRSAVRNAAPRPLSQRFLSTAPPHQRSRSWKSSFARWGLASAAVYYYNTSSAFADEEYTTHRPPQTAYENEENYATIDEISAARKSQKEAQASQSSTVETTTGALPGSPDALEEEADQQGAFNEETGEINWDCPCLGGMAHGPCGEEFRAAFSCFVYSKEEPKGVDCIDKFKGMQDCFRAHPDVYGSELDDDDDPELVGEGGLDDVPDGAEAGVGEAVATSPASAQAKVQTVAPEAAS